jgi:AcrR family transcriptional regulator
MRTLEPVPELRTRRTRTEAREDNRQAILRAARELIVEVGYSSAQLDEIGHRAGVTKGAIYSIFGSKLDLLRALIEQHANDFLPLFSLQIEGQPEQTAEEILTALARSYCRVIERDDVLALLSFELELSSLALRDPATLEGVLAHERALTERLARALATHPRRNGRPLDGDQSMLAANLVLGALGGLGQRAVTMPWSTRDPDIIAAALIRLLPTDETGRA